MADGGTAVGVSSSRASGPAVDSRVVRAARRVRVHRGRSRPVRRTTPRRELGWNRVSGRNARDDAAACRHQAQGRQCARITGNHQREPPNTAMRVSVRWIARWTSRQRAHWLVVGRPTRGYWHRRRRSARGVGRLAGAKLRLLLSPARHCRGGGACLGRTASPAAAKRYEVGMRMRPLERQKPRRSRASVPSGRYASQRGEQSGRPDLNRGPHRPERCALPGCATPRMGPVNHRRARRRTARAVHVTRGTRCPAPSEA
jgi:hypothetical protein